MLKKKFLRLAPFIWATLCVVYYIYDSGQRSGVHLFPLDGHSLEIYLSQISTINILDLILNTLTAFAGVLTFVLSAIGLGWFIIKLIDRKAETLDEGNKRIVTAFVVGQSLLSISFLSLLLTFRQLSQLSTIIIISIGLLCFFLYFRSIVHCILNGAKIFFSFANDHSMKIIGTLSLLLLGSTLFFSSSRLSYDAASQYFAQAKMITLSDQFVLLSYKDAFAGSALYLTSLQSGLINLFGDQASRMYSWMSGLAILSLGLMIGIRVGISRRAQWLFLPLILTSTVFTDLLGDGKIDLANTVCALASVYWFLRSLQKPSGLFLFFAAFFGGYAVIARPYNLLLLGVFFLLLFIYYFWSAPQRSDYFRTLLQNAKGLIPPILFWAGSYLIVNAVVLGNPFAQLSGFGLGTNDWPYYATGLRKLILIVLYPFAITYMGAFDTLGLISPFFLGVIPYLCVKELKSARSFSKFPIVMAIAAVFTVYIWIGIFGSLMILEVRYVLFLWIIVFLTTAYLLDHAMRIFTHIIASTQVIVSALLLFMVLRTFFISLATYSPITQNGIPECHDLPMCTFFEPINRVAHLGDRVLVLSAYRYYLRPDLLGCSSTREEYILLERAAIQSPDEFWEEVQHQGYHYIIYDSFFTQYILRFQDLPNLYVSLPPNGIILFNNSFFNYNRKLVRESVYQLESTPQIIPELTCVQVNNKWHVIPK